MTNYRQLMMDVIEGKATEFLPFAPRLEIWYRCNKIKGTLPEKYKNASLFEIVEDLDIGQNYMIPDFLQYGDIKNTYSRGLGHIFSTTATAYNLSFENIDLEAKVTGDLTVCTFKTPYGSLNTSVMYNDNMRNSGITIPAIRERLIKSVKDYKAAEYLFENLVIVPQYELYNQYADMIGNRTILNTFASQRVNGIHMLMMELMDYQDYVFNNIDYQEETGQLTAVLDKFVEKCIAVCVDSPAQIITTGCHFDHILTGRPIFKKDFMPYLKNYSKLINDKGKYMACHTDSDNENLLDLYVESGINIADSICTEPLTKQNYKDIRTILKNKITQFGVIPSIATMKNSMNDYEFDIYINKLMEEIQMDGARNIILAIADTTPPGADFERIKKIAKLSRQVKPF